MSTKYIFINETTGEITYPERDESLWWRKVCSPEVGPYETTVDVGHSSNYKRTRDIFSKFYDYFNLDPKLCKRHLYYLMYSRIMDICHVVTGEFWIKGDTSKSYTANSIGSGMGVDRCVKSHKEEFESLWSDILDVIEKHMNNIYEDNE